MNKRVWVIVSNIKCFLISVLSILPTWALKSTIVNYVHYKLNLEVVLPLKPTSWPVKPFTLFLTLGRSPLTSLQVTFGALLTQQSIKNFVCGSDAICEKPLTFVFSWVVRPFLTKHVINHFIKILNIPLGTNIYLHIVFIYLYQCLPIYCCVYL